MAINVLFLCPLKGNGGIQSWVKNMLTYFEDSDCHLYHVDTAPDKPFPQFKKYDAWYYGIKSFVKVFWKVRRLMRATPQIQLMHTTTSGGTGSLRDYVLGKVCKRKGLKLILHCHFGTVGELYDDQSWRGRVFRNALMIYDQIWVLDQHSASYLKSKEALKDKVFLTPNPITVSQISTLKTKSYRKIGYVGNLYPSKGVFELVKAVRDLGDDTELMIAGLGNDENISKIKETAQDDYGKRIHYLGWLSNEDALALIDSLDIMCLPTYYELEAFPISILEAMCRGKLIISCARVAIPDMLTSDDGTSCGILVKEKSSQAIADAIKWCQEHPDEADQMCIKAYNKVYTSYRDDIVYRLYMSNYNHAISK